MEREEHIHIKFLKYLLSRNNHFGYVEVRDFLLENFKDEKNDRVFMGRFLGLMVSENYIEYLPGRLTVGVQFETSKGDLIPRDEISIVVRIKPKGVELVNSYIINHKNLNAVYYTIGISILALLISLFSYNNSYKKQEYDFGILSKKIDSLSTEINKKDLIINKKTEYEPIDTIQE
ncbi:hypothetical protein MHL31_04280 [Lutibacter sp. A80]|uniref:hypothetical protein n=1 Tax=Lutibacter sp. A80 TaxID=2918453 RepID=UPI001F063A06|nr:hypothetical protein [Lutibacter sp. A80]UMB61426.1 hypothetical protein MHL31_04280 [Lutibacter sp. A80]